MWACACAGKACGGRIGYPEEENVSCGTIPFLGNRCTLPAVFLKSMLSFQKITHLFEQTLKGGLGGRWSGDNDVQAGFYVPQMGPKAFTQTTLDKISCHSVAYLFADGKTDLDAIAFGIKHHQISG